MIGAIFPGQGSQFVGMGKALYEEFKSFRENFELASDATKVNFKKLIFEGPESDLVLTENTQPALLLVSYATYELLEELFDFRPDYTAGHSLGEYTALVAANSINFEEAIPAVKARGKFMQEAVPVGKGGMAAILGLEDPEVRRLCEWAETAFGGPVEPANFNSPGQVVISGNKSTIDQIITNFDSEKVLGVKKRAKVIALNVSAPFHCTMMRPAEEKMAAILRQMYFNEELSVGVVQNYSAEEAGKKDGDDAIIRENLIRQISSPVLWTQSVKRLKQLGVRRVIECGPGKVLTGLVKKIDSEMVTFNIQNLEDIRNFEKEVDQWT